MSSGGRRVSVTTEEKKWQTEVEKAKKTGGYWWVLSALWYSNLPRSDGWISEEEDRRQLIENWFRAEAKAECLEADRAALVEALRKIRAVASAGPHEAECFDWTEWMQEADLALARLGSDDGVTA